MKLSTFKIKIIFFFLIMATLIGGYFYLTKMERISGNLNINKSNLIDKLCNYTVYSDFYYRVIEYEGKSENSYAELTPVKSTICYDLKNNKIELQSSIDEESNIILDDKNGANLEKKISLLEKFKTTYSKIIATQDKDYFDASYKKAKETMLSLYRDNKITLPKIDNPIEEYYTQISDLPIDNMTVQHYKLEKIHTKPLQSTKSNGWKPNILEWQFEESDKIYLQYLAKSDYTDLDDYVKNESSKSNKTLVRLTKFNNKKLNKMFLIFDDNQIKIKTLFMDNNGYLYILILQVSNKQSFNTYFDDYMKIAYGIFFESKDKLDSNFIKKQEEILNNYQESIKIINDIQQVYAILEEQQTSSILKSYKEMQLVLKTISLKSEIKEMDNSQFDVKYKKFKELYGTYPNEKIYSELSNTLKDLYLIRDGIEKFKPIVALFSAKNKYQEGAKKLQEQCNSIECIEKLKLNNWEKEKNE